MGCPDRCIGYELRADLDFDTDGDGDVDSDDDLLGRRRRLGTHRGFGRCRSGRVFEGNGETISNLFIDRDSENRIGLFGHRRPAEFLEQP